MTDDSIQELYEQFKKLWDELGHTIIKICEPLLEFLNALEPYQRFEILHPKKKPRGSIRRRKRGMI